MTNSKTTLILNKAHHIELSNHDRKKNIFINGMPSTGVSTFVSELIFQDINNGLKTVLLDPYGYLSTKILSRMSKEQLDDTVYIDIGNTDYPVGLNLFNVTSDEEKRGVANAVIELMYSLYDPNRTGIIGPRFDHAVRNAVQAVLYDGKSSFIELVRCFTDISYVNQIIPKISDPALRSYWTKQIASTSDFHKSETMDYIVSKFGRFVTDPKIRNIVNQFDASFDFSSLMAEKKVIIIDFSKFLNDYDAMKILSEIILSKINQYIKTIGDEDALSLYIDEIDIFSNRKLTELLRYGSLFNLNLSITTQRASSLQADLLNELLRVGTLIAFRLSRADAMILAPEFHKNISVDHLCLLNKFHMVIKTLKSGNPVIYEEINNENSDYDVKDSKDIEMIKLEKTKVYGRPVSLVEDDIKSRLV